jgi:hypothetical protein
VVPLREESHWRMVIVLFSLQVAAISICGRLRIRRNPRFLGR